MARHLVQPPQVAFVGPSGSGKTTLLEAVIRVLTAGGLRVGFVKHTHHRLDFDTLGKDSWRGREAGAEPVLLVTPERYLVQARRDADVEILFSGCDLVLHEGDRRSPHPKVLVGESAREARRLGLKGPVIASVGGQASEAIPLFARDDVEGVARFLRSYARAGREAAIPCQDPHPGPRRLAPCGRRSATFAAAKAAGRD